MNLLKIPLFAASLLLCSTILPMEQDNVNRSDDNYDDIECFQKTIEDLGIALSKINLRGDGYAFLPKEMLLAFFTSMDCEYPWQKIRFIHQLCTVCKKWYVVIIKNPKIIREMLKVKPLCWAAALGQADEIVRLKLKHGFSLHEPDEYRFLPRDYAVGNGQLDCMKILRVGGALVTRDQNNDLLREEVEILKGYLPQEAKGGLLLVFLEDASTAHYDTWDEFGKAGEELASAAEEEDYNKVLEFLIKQQAKYQFNPICEWIKDGQLTDSKIALLLIYHEQASYERDLLNGFRDLASRDNSFLEEYFTKFKKFQANPNVLDDEGKSPLYLASQKPECLPLVKQLLACGNIDLDIRCQKKVKSYVFKGWTPLHNAAWLGNDICLQEMLNVKGCNPNVVDEDGHTPLHCAALTGKTNCVNLLLKNKANVDAVRNNDGNTPLHCASANGRTECVKVLLDAPASVNKQNNDQNTPLHLASIKGHLECARSLIDAGANINKQGGIDLNTPLHYAASEGHLGIVRLLFECGANKTLKNRRGATILDYARAGGNTDIVEFLRSQK